MLVWIAFFSFFRKEFSHSLGALFLYTVVGAAMKDLQRVAKLLWVVCMLGILASRPFHNTLAFASGSFKLGLRTDALQISESSTRASPIDLGLKDGNSEIDAARQCTVDLLALLGGKQAAATVNKSRAHEILECIRFLVPVRPNVGHGSLEEGLGDGGLTTGVSNGGMLELSSAKDFQKLIMWPPPEVAALARSAVEWGGDPNVIKNALGPITYKVPDVDGSSEQQCQLTTYEYGQRFARKEINAYMAFLFRAIATLAPPAGLNVSLTRFDLYHGHMFTAYDTGRLGILFHAREYPAYDEKIFSVNLGFCQKGSNVSYDRTMELRNLVWLAPMPNCREHLCKADQWLTSGSLFILDTKPDGIINQALVPEYLDIVHTVSESDFGNAVLDVNYFNIGDDLLPDRIFLC